MIEGERKMSDVELVAEVEWLAMFGVHPLNIVAALGRKVTAIEMSCRRAGRSDLAYLFKDEISRQRWAVVKADPVKREEHNRRQVGKRHRNKTRQAA